MMWDATLLSDLFRASFFPTSRNTLPEAKSGSAVMAVELWKDRNTLFVSLVGNGRSVSQHVWVS